MSFDLLQTALERAQAPAGAAESHGTVCGVVCAGFNDPAVWHSHVLGETANAEAARECIALLTALQETVLRQLKDFDMNFVPLLPADTQPLAERVEALALWCQGYLFGLSLGHPREPLDNLTGEAGEVLQDVAEIARAGLETGDEEGGEADEQAYSELVEYLRVAVQILYEELNRVASPRTGPDKPLTLH